MIPHIRKALLLLLVSGLFALASAESGSSAPTTDTPQTDTAIFAGGCFWCMEEAFEKVPGVLTVVSGYTGGHVENPSYRQVSSGRTGHAEAVEVTYDPSKVTYNALLEVFWHNVDPLTPNAQFCDHGSQYRSAIFPRNEEQKKLAEASKQALIDSKRFDKPIVTEIVMATTFYPAEGYHQDFYKKNPAHYHFYKYNCGRAQRLKDLWGQSSG